MREKIAKTLFVSYQREIKAQLEADTEIIGMLTGEKERVKGINWSKLGEEYKELYRSQANPILTLITEEIEKVENPYQYEETWSYKAFEACRHKILSLLKEEK